MRQRLVVLARWPAPGRCKRRLAAGCGSAAAAAVQRALTAHTLAVARLAARQAGARLELVVDGIGARARRRWARQLAVSHSARQGSGSLGCRLQRQLRLSFRAGAERVVVIGTDLPSLECADLLQAFAALERQPLVLGPASDGGYWLIGLNRSGFNRAGARLMVGMPWGTEAVLPQTLARALALELPPLLLRQQSDLDRCSDLQPWLRPALQPWSR
ncbi:MAG: hypothetical protein RLZZ611_1453 [Cyanobacteriota bacterium]|jgi:rSAM/selenodomain-associated transferase 1